MSRVIVSFVIIAIMACSACAVDGQPEGSIQEPSRLLIFGASGRIGGHIVEEALQRGYDVTAVSRDATRLAHLQNRATVAVADILDQKRLAEMIAGHDAVIVSVGGTPTSNEPQSYIAYTAATRLIETFETLRTKKRLLFVGNLYTLKFEDDKTLLELGRVPATHRNFAMFYGHQLALDRFEASDNINWTVATPPNGLRLSGRTARVRWGGKTLLRDEDGTPSTISPEDFAYAVLQELQQGNYVRKQFNVAR